MTRSGNIKFTFTGDSSVTLLQQCSRPEHTGAAIRQTNKPPRYNTDQREQHVVLMSASIRWEDLHRHGYSYNHLVTREWGWFKKLLTVSRKQEVDSGLLCEGPGFCWSGPSWPLTSEDALTFLIMSHTFLLRSWWTRVKIPAVAKRMEVLLTRLVLLIYETPTLNIYRCFKLWAFSDVTVLQFISRAVEDR